MTTTSKRWNGRSGLYEGGVTSKQNYDHAVQAFENSKADWESSKAARVTQQRQLAYYHLTAPFDGIVGDIPVHIGDYVSPQTLADHSRREH